jgi:hypothetical protein
LTDRGDSISKAANQSRTDLIDDFHGKRAR